jgi:hypothetical protein
MFSRIASLTLFFVIKNYKKQRKEERFIKKQKKKGNDPGHSSREKPPVNGFSP